MTTIIDKHRSNSGSNRAALASFYMANNVFVFGRFQGATLGNGNDQIVALYRVRHLIGAVHSSASWHEQNDKPNNNGSQDAGHQP